ncbi:phage head spike fiber domain-containing protein [Pseudoalteromonas piratica]|uniref:Uncharacterized protein n=1 Tax=Pseudoalteromonas piratica TaxID=1348114 RepID=A0A0A7EF06_9GAMM|nr:hypothetical protein [Pseudoalteromonas piratica]AIY65204.1 hypothetical protein OM33_08550 [Pseudoalteromonas piratica]
MSTPSRITVPKDEFSADDFGFTFLTKLKALFTAVQNSIIGYNAQLDAAEDAASHAELAKQQADRASAIVLAPFSTIELYKLMNPLTHISGQRYDLSRVAGGVAFTNATADRQYYNRYGQSALAAANERCFTTRGEQLAPTFKNLLLQSATHNNAAWTKDNVTILPSAGEDTNGNLTLTRVTNSKGAVGAIRNTATGITNDNLVKTAAVELKADDATHIKVELTLTGGATPVTQSVVIDLRASVPQVLFGTPAFYKFDWQANGVGVLHIGVQNNASGNTSAILAVYPSVDPYEPDTTASAGSLYLGDTIVTDSAQPTPLARTTTAQRTVQADFLTFPTKDNFPPFDSAWTLVFNAYLNVPNETTLLFNVAPTSLSGFSMALIVEKAKSILFRFGEYGAFTDIRGGLTPGFNQIVVVHRNNQIELYLNGVSASYKKVGTYPMVKLDSVCSVMSQFNNSQHTAGTFVSADIHAYAASPDAIAALYSSTYSE